MIRLTGKGAPDLAKLKKQLPDRLRQLQHVVGRQVAKDVGKAVRDKIKGSEKWINIYRKSITYREREGGGKWAVAGILPIAPSELWEMHELAFVFFKPGTPISDIMAGSGPWTLDTIPAIEGGYMLDVYAEFKSESLVKSRRSTMMAELPTVVAALETAGKKVLPTGTLPIINGKAYIDMRYLAAALEDGRGGYPRIPHWGPVKGRLKKIAEKSVGNSEVQTKGKGALLGSTYKPDNVMTAAEAKKLAKIRESSLP